MERRLMGFVILSVIYLTAALMGWMAFLMFSSASLLWRLFFADVAATLLVWLAGVVLKNSSVYDPYWSVAPIVMIPAAALFLDKINWGTVLLIAVVLFWGIRLTLNWAYTFKSLKVQDWRYTQYKRENPRLWGILNLFGINLFPTVIVFLVMIPAFLFIRYFETWNVWIVLCALLCVSAVILQLVSDMQMHRFRKSNPGKVNQKGLWKWSRHPNYLGEILMWWGVYLMTLSVDPGYWMAGVGALANTLMFLFVSIPLMENRQLQNKPEYREYQTDTGVLLPKL